MIVNIRGGIVRDLFSVSGLNSMDYDVISSRGSSSASRRKYLRAIKSGIPAIAINAMKLKKKPIKPHPASL